MRVLWEPSHGAHRPSNRRAEALTEVLRKSLAANGMAPVKLCETAALQHSPFWAENVPQTPAGYHWMLYAELPNDATLDWAAIRALLDQHVTLEMAPASPKPAHDRILAELQEQPQAPTRQVPEDLG